MYRFTCRRSYRGAINHCLNSVYYIHSLCFPLSFLTLLSRRYIVMDPRQSQSASTMSMVDQLRKAKMSAAATRNKAAGTNNTPLTQSQVMTTTAGSTASTPRSTVSSTKPLPTVPQKPVEQPIAVKANSSNSSPRKGQVESSSSSAPSSTTSVQPQPVATVVSETPAASGSSIPPPISTMTKQSVPDFSEGTPPYHRNTKYPRIVSMFKKGCVDFCSAFHESNEKHKGNFCIGTRKVKPTKVVKPSQPAQEPAESSGSQTPNVPQGEFALDSDMCVVDDDVQPRLLKPKYGEYEYLTYKELARKCQYIGSALSNMLTPNSVVGVLSRNRAEAVIAELSCVIYGYIPVILPVSDKQSVLQICLQQSQPSLVFASREDLPGLYMALEEVPRVKYVVLLDKMAREDADAAPGWPDFRLLSYHEMLDTGMCNMVAVKTSANPNDDAVMLFDAEPTPGKPPIPYKLTHMNLVAAMTGIYKCCGMAEDDLVLIHEPLAVPTSQLMMLTALSAGASIAFSQGSDAGPRIMEDMAAVRPTLVMIGADACKSLSKSIKASFAEQGAAKRRLAQGSYNKRLTQLTQCRDSNTAISKSVITDKLTVDYIRKLTGGRVRLIVCPVYCQLAIEIVETLEVTLAPVSCMFGVAGTSGVAFMRNSGDFIRSHVGPPVVSCEVKLRAVEGFDLDGSPPIGEVLVRGPNVCIKRAGSDGWLRTGYIGQWNPDGTLTLCGQIGRISLKSNESGTVAPVIVKPTIVNLQGDVDSGRDILPSESESERVSDAEGADDLEGDDVVSELSENE